MLVLLGFATLILLAIGGRAGYVLLQDLLAERRTTTLRSANVELRRIKEDGSRYAAERQLQARKLDLEERAIAVQEQKAKNPAVPTSIPPDLYRRIAQWQDPDAQDAERKVLLDLYQEFRDSPDPWVEVRAHLPKAPHDDDLPTELFTQ